MLFIYEPDFVHPCSVQKISNLGFLVNMYFRIANFYNGIVTFTKLTVLRILEQSPLGSVVAKDVSLFAPRQFLTKELVNLSKSFKHLLLHFIKLKIISTAISE